MPGFVEEVTNYDELLCSQPRVIDMVPVATSQTIKRGDLLVCAVTTTVAGSSATAAIGSTFSKASAVAAPGNLYMIAAEDVTTTSSAGEVLAYGAGDYNINRINNLTGDETTNRLVLLQQGIVLHHAQSGVVSLPSED